MTTSSDAPAVTGVAAQTPVPVVGIGASAGGLDAIAELLSALPATTGLAYLVVQHLAPERTSLLAEILSKRTAKPVVEANEGMRFLPDRVYVIPPSMLLSLDGVLLHLAARSEGRLPSMS
ncbi:MAG: methylase of chemotaxis methyl-accepting protein, partial [Burkholderiales bacterium]|nr:methylase of chemotaxis methyl-accepting protein [Burkholderiales bacterium]